jgi:hypothetical protein
MNGPFLSKSKRNGPFMAAVMNAGFGRPLPFCEPKRGGEYAGMGT